MLWWRLYFGVAGVFQIAAMLIRDDTWGDKAFAAAFVPLALWLIYSGVRPALEQRRHEQHSNRS